MFDPITIERLAYLRQKEIFDSIYGTHRMETSLGLRDALTGLWHSLHLPPKQTQPWQPTRTVRSP